MFSPLFASFIYLARGLLKLLNILLHYDYALIQKVDLFYGMYSIFIFLMVISSSIFAVNILQQIK